MGRFDGGILAYVGAVSRANAQAHGSTPLRTLAGHSRRDEFVLRELAGALRFWRFGGDVSLLVFGGIGAGALPPIASTQGNCCFNWRHGLAQHAGSFSERFSSPATMTSCRCKPNQTAQGDRRDRKSV